MGETLAQAMQRVKAATSLKAFCDSHLEARPRDGRDHYVCPACKSGNKRGDGRGTAAFHLYDRDGETRYKCSSCGTEGDIFDLAGIVILTDDTAEQCNAVAEWAGVDGWQKDRTADTRRNWDGTVDRGEAIGWDDTAEATGGPITSGAAEDTAQDDYTDFYRKAHNDLMASAEALAYLHGRGITDETIKRHMLGYVASWTHPKDGRHHTKRIIMPRTAGTYTARAFDETERDYSQDYKKQVVGSQRDIFNLKAARGADVVVIVEGELDAASIVQATGYVAVGLGSISNVPTFPDKARAANDGATWLVALDNDKPKPDGKNPGQDAQKRLIDGMRAAGLACYGVDGARLYGEYKDANDVLVAEPSHLKAALDEQVGEIAADGEEERYRAELAGLCVFDPSDVTEGLFTMEDVLAPIPTGLNRVDYAIGGGLPAQGLVTLGAVSSVGKTSWVLQICDHVAACGRPVLFCSVEQGRKEIAAKSLSRIMGTMARENGARMVASAQAILNREERERWEREDVEKVTAFTRACGIYHQRTHREDGTPTLYIMEPNVPPTVADIRKAAEAIQRRNGQAPVVAVDYVQLLAAPAGLERGTDKQILDANTLGIRQMARDMETCVIAISSLNRASYAGSIDLNSFKESGMLEYSSDLLLGMQPYGLQEAMRGKSEDSGAARAKAKEIMRDYKEAAQKQVELVILKNRNGGIHKSPCLTFDGITSTFLELGAPGAAKKPARL